MSGVLEGREATMDKKYECVRFSCEESEETYLNCAIFLSVSNAQRSVSSGVEGVGSKYEKRGVWNGVQSVWCI